jgi:hypothetical protein
MRRALVLAVLLSGFVATAEALTIRDVIELTRAGVGEDVLLALIEVDRGIYAIDPATLRKLKEAGVSEKVIIALVRSGRQPVDPELPPVPPPTEAAPSPEPQVIVIEHQQPARIEQVMVPVPVYIPVVQGRTRIHRGQPVPGTVDYSTFVPFQSGRPFFVRPEPSEPSRAPVYWGHGGKLRPDAWGQPRAGERDTSKEASPREPRDKK